jgi:hypothetical protein
VDAPPFIQTDSNGVVFDLETLMEWLDLYGSMGLIEVYVAPGFWCFRNNINKMRPEFFGLPE